MWEGSLQLEAVARPLTALCWWINTSYRVTVRFIYSRHSALGMTCSLQRSPWGENVSVSTVIHFIITLHHAWKIFIGAGMCHLSTERDNPACWHVLFLQSFPEHSLDSLSSFTALLLTSWQEGRLRGKRCILPPPLFSLCSSLVCESRSKFGSVISGWSEPVFVGIILHRRLGLKP